MATLGFGIIGCGNISAVHAQALEHIKGAKLVAVADVRQENADKMADEYGAVAYTDYKAMLEREDVHAVSLCVPSGMRVEIAADCAAAGKHILSEKPLEVSTERIDQILEATDKHQVYLGCIFQSRYSDDSQRIREALDAGRFGELVLGDAYIKWYRSPEYYASGAWRGTRKLDGGGCLMNQGIHQIDLLQWFMGPVKTVQAQTTRRLHKGLEVEDLATAMLEFQSGAFGVIEGSTAIWPGHPARIEVHGSEGSAVLEDGKLRQWQFSERQEADSEVEAALHEESALGSGAGDPLASLKIEGHLRNIRDFVQSIAQGKEPVLNGREGRHAVELIEAIYQAADTGKPVHINQQW